MVKPEIVYLSARFEAQARMRLVRRRINSLGYRVQSQWVDEEPPAPGPLTLEQAWAFAIRDLAETAQCDLLILDTFEEDDRGGREVEWGLGLMAARVSDDSGPECWLVGPRRNVFHSLAGQHYEWWGECFMDLVLRRKKRESIVASGVADGQDTETP